LAGALRRDVISVVVLPRAANRREGAPGGLLLREERWVLGFFYVLDECDARAKSRKISCLRTPAVFRREYTFFMQLLFDWNLTVL